MASDTGELSMDDSKHLIEQGVGDWWKPVLDEYRSEEEMYELLYKLLSEKGTDDRGVPGAQNLTEEEESNLRNVSPLTVTAAATLIVQNRSITVQPRYRGTRLNGRKSKCAQKGFIRSLLPRY